MDQHSSHTSGKEAISEMTLTEARELDPAISDQIEAMRPDPAAAVLSMANAEAALADLARSAGVPLNAVVEDVQHGQPPADNTPPVRLNHREAEVGHRESPEERLALPLAVFDVLAEVEQLQREPAWADGDRNAKTLVKKPDLRKVVMVLKAGARLEEHFAPGSITIYTLAGRLRVAAGEQSVELNPGQMLSLDGGHRHDLEALELSAFLLTVAR
jgi:quercetin dioxygenase-like cupin family protein